MKIEKYILYYGYYHYYVNNKTDIQIWHGLYNKYYIVGYHYHSNIKGFWLRKKRKYED